MIVSPRIFNSPEIITAQSTRLGGVSPAPFFSLNLGLSVNDDKERVLKNRELFFSSLGIPLSALSISHQVHGHEVLVVNEPGHRSGYDAQITNRKHVFLVVSIADCTPILIHDTKQQAVAAIHAGWRGTASNIVQLTLQAMHEQYGTEGKHCRAFIGACIGYSNFEVGSEVAQHFDESLKRFDEHKQKWLVDLKTANQQQLLRFGVPLNQIEVSDYCTIQHNQLFFSHRYEKGITGRMMAVIGMKQ